MKNKDMDAIAFYNLAAKYGKMKIPNKQDAEDFRAYAIEQWLRNGRKARLDWVYVEWMRKKYGKKIRTHEREAIFDPSVLEKMPDESESYFDFSEIYLQLPIADTILINLSIKWGMTADEIADVFGVTKGRISQVRALVMDRLKALKKKFPRD